MTVATVRAAGRWTCRICAGCGRRRMMPACSPVCLGCGPDVPLRGAVSTVRLPGLRRVREERRLPVPVLAARAQVTRATVYGLQAGRHCARPETAERLAGALGTSVSDLTDEG